MSKNYAHMNPPQSKVDEIFDAFANEIVRRPESPRLTQVEARRQIYMMIADIISPIPDYDGDHKTLVDAALKNYERYMHLRAMDFGVEL